MQEQAFPDLTVPFTKKREQSERYLILKHNQLKQFGNVEDLVTDERFLNEKDREGILHNLVVLRSALAKALWKAGIFIGVSILDEFVLGAVQAGQADICGRVVSRNCN